MASELFNSREVATFIWFLIIFVWLFKINFFKNEFVKNNFKNIGHILTNFNIIIILSFLLSYVCFIIYFLSIIELWDVMQLKNTIYWFFSFACLSIFKVSKINNLAEFSKRTFYECFSLIVIIAFISGTYTFPLFLEMLIIPVNIVLLIIMTAPGYSKRAKVCSKTLLFIIIFFIFSFTIYLFVSDMNKIFDEQKLKDFILPIILTILYLPFLLLLKLYMDYEKEFLKIKNKMNNKKLFYISFVCAIIYFNFRVDDFKKWINYLIVIRPKNFMDFFHSFNETKKVIKGEKSTNKIDFKNGWSILEAKNFLKNKGFLVGTYKYYNVRYAAFSNTLTFKYDGKLDSLIEYEISGDENKINKLILRVSICDIKDEDKVLSEFFEVADILCLEACDKKLSKSLRCAFLNSKNRQERTQHNKIILNFDKACPRSLGAYSGEFSILNDITDN